MLPMARCDDTKGEGKVLGLHPESCLPSALVERLSGVGVWYQNAINFDEEFYLASNPGVAAAVRLGQLPSGREHWLRFGRTEGRVANCNS
jgi:hypothetical protein